MHVRSVLIAAVMTIAACGAPAGTPAQRSVTVEVKGFEFSPPTIEVATGTTVVWINRDNVLHTATSGAATKKDEFGNYDKRASGVFDARMGDAGVRSSFTFTTAGEHTYYCDRHPHMTGKVTVR